MAWIYYISFLAKHLITYWWKTWADWYRDNIIIATTKKYFRQYCLHGCTSEEVLKNYLERCKLHGAQRVKLTEAGSKNGRAKFKFEKTEYQLRFPFVIYADFESILWKQDSCEPSSSKSFTFSIFTCQVIVVADFFICWLEWFGADRAAGDVVVFPPLLLSQPFHRILLVTCCLQMVAAARTWSKNLVQCHPLYSLEIVGSIVHHFISRRCSSQMVRDAGIGW